MATQFYNLQGLCVCTVYPNPHTSVYLLSGEETGPGKVSDLLEVAGGFTGVPSPIGVFPCMSHLQSEQETRRVVRAGCRIAPRCRSHLLPVPFRSRLVSTASGQGGTLPPAAPGQKVVSVSAHVFWAQVGQFPRPASFPCFPLLPTEKRSILLVGSPSAHTLLPVPLVQLGVVSVASQASPLSTISHSLYSSGSIQCPSHV